MKINPGDIVRINLSPAHEEMVGLVTRIMGDQLCVDLIGAHPSVYCPPVNESQVQLIPNDKWTDGQFQAYARWRDANKEIKP